MMESKLLALKEAVEKKDVNKVNELLSNDQKLMDHLKNEKNRKDAMNLLRPVIVRDDDEMLRILLEKGVLIGGTLFTAVRSNSLECVKVMLEMSENEEQKNGTPYLVLPDYIPKKTSLSAPNPFMLAIELNRHKIVEHFIKEENVFVKDSENTDKNNEDVRARVLLDFHKFKARANPIYISYMFIHDKNKKLPIFQLYDLHKKLLEKSYIDDEYKEDYIKLAHQCEDFAVELINLCHDLDETKEITKFSALDSKKNEDKDNEHMTDIPESLIFLKKAIKRKWDKVVAHPYSQLQLNVEIHPPNVVNISEWCKNSKIEFHRWSNDKWREKSHWKIARYALWHFIAMPFLAVVCIFDAKRTWKVTRYMKNPMIKFTSHYSSLLVFVSLLIASSFQDKFYDELLKPSIPEWLILVWLVGFIVQAVEEIWYQEKNYFAQWWNITTFLMLLFFTISYFLRVIAYGITGSWAVLDPITDFSPTASYKVILLANSFYSLAMLFSFITLSAIFQVNDVLGPLQLSLGHLLYDVLKFAIFFTYIVLGFGLSLRKLYSHYITTQQQIAKMRRAASTNGTHHEDHQLSDVGSGFAKLFWALFGIHDLKIFDTKDKNFSITKETGEVLFGLFQVIAVIVTINMLIAMMSRSFNDIASDAMVKWKLSRTRLWMNWIQKKIVLPSPLNVIETLVHFTWKYTSGRCKKETLTISSPARGGTVNEGHETQEEEIGLEGVKKEERTDEDKKTREILKRILRRYIAASKEKHKEKEFWTRTIHGREGGLNIHPFPSQVKTHF